jgi:hypothetical protein
MPLGVATGAAEADMKSATAVMVASEKRMIAEFDLVEVWRRVVLAGKNELFKYGRGD